MFEFDSLELHDLTDHGDDGATGRYLFDLVEGYWGGLAVRGDDVTYPGASGRTVLNRIGDRRTIRAHGYVLGADPTDFGLLMDGLMAVCDPAASPANLVVTGPYMGLGDDVTRTISARFQNIVQHAPRSSLHGLVVEADLVWESVDPDWTQAGSGS